MNIILTLGLALLGLGIFGAIKGYGVENPVGRLLNVEVANFGLMLIFLSLNEAVALLTFAAASVLTTVVFMRLFLRISILEKMKEEK
ncbi:hypothetical protein AKJ65_02650 [candidate division MSBL1 archaeon SCGC-AAA259E19]|uniref:Uncharacterized protein n=1 Tax=candidate division MSBL1 archaeon SCGC-AAA259E19 TaxID=1698264 RepID=A0A133ULP4_9EURY|nr:hypothetical protein AKJ65_02650 [candidate division MSBL1 archaeon SCGC-AAA259E19]